MRFITATPANGHDYDFEEYDDIVVFTRDEAITFGSLTRFDFHSVSVPYLHGFTILKTGACRTRYDRAITKSELADILAFKPDYVRFFEKANQS